MASGKLSDDDLEEICEYILSGQSLTEIAENIGVACSTLVRWLDADTQRSARARECRALMAQVWDEVATAKIEEAADPFELAKAKELAHHYRWRAAKIAPKTYGDKTTLSNDPDAPFAALPDAQLLNRIAALQAKLNAGTGGT